MKFESYFEIPYNSLWKCSLLTNNMLQVFVHENYSYPNNDIALIRLRRKANIGNFVGTVCLPNGEEPKNGEICVATGYGTTSTFFLYVFYEYTLHCILVYFSIFEIAKKEKCTTNFSFRDLSFPLYACSAQQHTVAVRPLFCKKSTYQL